MALYLDVGPNDLIRVGDGLEISVERKSGSRARLRFVGTTPVELEKRGKLIADVAEEEDGRKS